jgi:DNA-binding MarR family transcriptional regulator
MALGLEPKELFILSEIDAHPFPAELAATLCIPKPTVTVYLKNLEAAGFVKREIDVKDLRRHRLSVTPLGRKVMAQGLSLLSSAYNVRLGKLSHAEQNELKGLLEKMTSA